MIEGITINLAGQDYVIPPLNLRGVKQCKADIARMTSVTKNSDPLNAERFEAVCRIVHAAMIRNYPDVKLEELEDMLDLGNMNDTIEAVLAQSGLKHHAEDAPPSGEAQPSPSTGTGSMQS